MEDLIVLAVVGMPATGKSEVIKKLKEDFNFTHLYYGDITFDEIKRRGLEINEVNERMVREEFRASGDLGVYSRFILPKITEAIQKGSRKILLESMYNVYEYEIIKQAFPENFKVLAIHSDAALRLKRIGSRTDRRLSIEELDSRQIAEAKKLGKGAVIALADFHYVNNGDNMKVFNGDLNILLKEKMGLTTDTNYSSKNFNKWNEVKKQTDILQRKVKIKKGRVYWCRLGENIGNEEKGKGSFYQRPVMILKKFSNEVALVLPLTTKNKQGDWYYNLPSRDIQSTVILNQAKVIDVKRLENFIYEIDATVMDDIVKNFLALISR